MTTPGTIYKTRKNEKTPCDKHPDVFATWMMVGETDSFGSEYHYLCDVCKTEVIEARNKIEEVIPEKTCEYCKTTQDAYFVEDGKKVSNFITARDPEEGSYGRLYTICLPCRKKSINSFVN